MMGIFDGLLNKFNPNENLADLTVANEVETLLGQGEDARFRQSDNILKAFGGINPAKRAKAPTLTRRLSILQQAQEMQKEDVSRDKLLEGLFAQGSKERQQFGKDIDKSALGLSTLARLGGR